MRLAMIACLSILMLLVAAASEAQSPSSAVGRWKTIDDATGKAKSIVEIYQAKDGRLAGKVVEVLDLKDGPNPTCDKCTGAQPRQADQRAGDPVGPAPGWRAAGGVAAACSTPRTARTTRPSSNCSTAAGKLGMSGCIAFLCRQQVWLRE